MAPQKLIEEHKDKQIAPDKRVEEASSEEESSEYSHESASGFRIMPVAKTSEKKTPSSKKFSDEDEIALLQGLAVFWANGRNNKWSEFHNFIKDDLPNPFTKIQVSEKIRKFKKKFETNWEKARANGGCLDFSNPHDSLVFELSKKLWGDEKNTVIEKGNKDVGENKISRKRKQGEENRVLGKSRPGLDTKEFELAYPLMYASFDEYPYPMIVKDNCWLIGRDKAEEFEKKWRELKAEEHCLEVKNISLIKGLVASKD